ncbi:uncharacterized protein SCHCODRAFT_02618709 [Schizophyllum commune H4-8]|uniref:F-box domain-containing protein n=1 Tax=Schizophyllum commune (strain H4-8 / FGSC 9210) TaxID=578458 RepID=D8Q0U0_SCHCM|nr:uncharacterized protein SCHCODRAFT_02618709 [Schizophyllum commune H4-8]KAI5895145.1 hypothetical protein SCHCODRAFT_02618709 [Schizophyllum commune H4-8]
MNTDRESIALATLPEEIILQILAICSVREVLSVGCTCTRLHAITQQNILWIILLRDSLAPVYPIPHDVLAPDLSHDPKTLVRHYADIGRAWLRQRSQPPKNILQGRDTKDPLLGLELLQEQWLLIVRVSSVEVWYIGTEEHKRIGVLSFAETARWTSYAAAVEDGKNLVVVLTNGMSGQSAERNSEVFRVQLRVPKYNVRPTSSFASIPNDPAQRTVQCIDPETRQIAFSRPGMVDIVRYPPDPLDPNSAQEQEPIQYASISTEREDLEELWNGIVAIRFVREHVLIVRARSVQVYANPLFSGDPEASTTDPRASHRTAPSSAQTDRPPRTSRASHVASEPPPCVQHAFPGNSFRQVSVSALTQRPDSPNTYDVQILANEVLQGLFLFDMTLVFPSRASATEKSQASLPSIHDIPLPLLDVRLRGVYAMSMSTQQDLKLPRKSGSALQKHLTRQAIMHGGPPPLMRGGQGRPTMASASNHTMPGSSRPLLRGGAARPMMPPLAAPSLTPASSTAQHHRPHVQSSSFAQPQQTSVTLHQAARAESQYQIVSARGFVSAFALGPRARRAVWVERRRGSTLREIFAWDWRESMVEVTPVEEDAGGSSGTVEEMDVDGVSQTGGARPEGAVDGGPGSATSDDNDAPHALAVEAPREMTGAAVFTLESYDLRDDITHCTFSETEGIILFGTRAGGVFLLRPGYHAELYARG